MIDYIAVHWILLYLGSITHYGDLKYMMGMEIARFYAYSRYVSETARDRDHTDHV